MKHVFQWQEFPEQEVFPKIWVKVISGERVMVVKVRAGAGGRAPRHRHEQEQIVQVLKGKMKVTTGGQENVLGPGDIWVVPANCPHAVEYLEDTETFEAVSPIRLDHFIGFAISQTIFEDEEAPSVRYLTPV